MRSEECAMEFDTLRHLPILTERQKTSQCSRNEYNYDWLQECQHETDKTEDSRHKATFQESTNLVYSYADPSLVSFSTCKPPCFPNAMPLKERKTYKNSEEKKHINPGAAGLSYYQFASFQEPSIPSGASPRPQYEERRYRQPLIDVKQINDGIVKSPSRAERQPFSPSVSSEYGNDYLATMKKLAELSMLPKPELIHFDGNPLRYYIFMKNFENQVEKDTDDNGRRLQLLIQHCSGKAKKVIESCILLSEEEGYKEAKRLLEERFGSKYMVSSSWINKVSNGPSIQPNVREAIMDLADDLRN